MAYRAVDLIMAKREGRALSQEELDFLIQGYVAGAIPDYQMAAWAMAVFFQGMSPAETAALTRAMAASGERMDLSGVEGPLVDKHSTGGVGDKTSLVVAPLAAALGLRDPMISGRALGHTGGTLDKLEAIPGYRTTLSREEFRERLLREGFAMSGQSRETAPADRLLYALRDVTATVESVPLITASILSKKAAEGAAALVLDVKYGSGAFMKEPEQAERLARSLADSGAALGMGISALLTDMDEPLGNMVGNFLEVEEALDCLEGKGPPDLVELCLELAARMAVLGGKAATVAEGRRRGAEALAGGKPRALFLANIAGQGGDVEGLLRLRGNYRSPVRGELGAERGGFISRIDAGKVGRAGVLLGIGRQLPGDGVSPTAGVQLHRKRGDAVARGEPVMSVWARDEEGLAAALPLLAGAVEYGAAPPAPRKLVLKEIPSR